MALVSAISYIAASRIRINAEADGQPLDEIVTPDAEGKKLLLGAAERLKLSARGYHRVLRVSRTLDGVEHARRLHVAEALSSMLNRQSALTR